MRCGLTWVDAIEPKPQCPVTLLVHPGEEPDGTVVVFQDLYGNHWDLIQPRAGAHG
jgi:hypothetical protein